MLHAYQILLLLFLNSEQVHCFKIDAPQKQCSLFIDQIQTKRKLLTSNVYETRFECKLKFYTNYDFKYRLSGTQ